MALSKEELYKEAIKLAPVDRAQLVEDILSSFSFKKRSENDEAWATEAERRIAAYEKDEIGKVSIDQVFQSIDSLK